MIRNLLAVAMIVAIGLAAWSVWLQLDRPVRSVRVEGALTAAEQRAIREVVSHSLKPGILSLDLDDLGTRIHDLSWPRTVEVRRLWPDALVIRVEKEAVVAAWGDGGYLNSAGAVVTLADGSEDVPTLATAMAPPRRAMEVYQMLASRLQPRGLRIARLEENELGEWLVTLGDGMSIALGNEAIGDRLARFLTAWDRGLSDRADQITHVDTRYGNGVAVRDSVGAAARPRTAAAEDSRPGGRSHDSRPGGRALAPRAPSRTSFGRSHNTASTPAETDYALR